MLAANRARSYRSNTEEFIHVSKRQRLSEPISNIEDTPMQDLESSSSARTSAKKVDRETQMKYDIAKNPDGPLGRTMQSKLVTQERRDGLGQGTGGSLISPLLKAALAAGTPTIARHPGLQERYDNIETHLGIRWGEYVPSLVWSNFDKYSTYFRQSTSAWPT